MIETDALGAPVEVADLDAEWLLALASEAESQCRVADRRKLRLAAQWCALHPASVDTGFATWSDTGLPGLGAADEALGGEGTPLVAAFAPEPFAAALGVSTLSGLQLLADALDLQHRLPHTWAAVEALEVAPWKARKIARATHSLPREAAAYVDRQLADRAGSCGWPTVERAIARATATFDPGLLSAKEREGRARWGVHLHHAGGGLTGDDAWAGTSHLDIVGDTHDLTQVHDLVCDQAAQLKAWGDTDSLDVRKAKAVGVIADRQTTLDLDESGAAPVRGRRAAADLHVHVDLADLDTGLDAGLDAGPRTGRVERLGPATLERIATWLSGGPVTVRPVLDLASTESVDRHDPPEWMRELVVLRDGHCVFPWCARDARACDLDHIEPHDEHGPPGQTRPGNLAPLCRRHHRAKTHGRWRYRRQSNGSFHWTGPHSAAFLVTPHGTVPLP